MQRYQPFHPEQACQLESRDDYWECKNCGTKVKKFAGSVGVPFLACRKPEFSDPRILPIQEAADQPWKKVSRVNRAAGGVGTELTKLLHRFGFRHTAGCQCGSRAAALDSMEIDEAESKIDVVVGWLREEAEKRKLPFIDAAGKKMVKWAIANARRKKQKSAQ